ncbi:uncharacterized protein LOC111329428 [Stylophora pistillata]|uniref:uncharacterized protein LOC111329428 n=1 Tax=Stylophora pistillata TaxID=50429 RepID=UPI000C043964|nr:uncharacterized protein LOC111329428 [Stylophora pistillata]
MAAAQEYTNEQLNYFRVCYLTTDIIAEGLRAIFKQEWDGRYKTTLGEWKDEPQSGLHFKNSESPLKQREKNRLLATMVNGNRAEWDCTMLFYAILFSDCIGNGLNPTIRSKVDDLRKFRNEDFAHMPHGNLTDAEFQNAINKVDVAFQALGLSTDQIEEIQNQTSFPTDELKNVLKRVEDLKQELEVLEAQLNKDISAFCVLPPKPTHEVADRDLEVAKIVKHLKDLREANKNRLSYLYISGNPGSGKSQLAGLVSKRVFDQVNEIPHSTSFVMTVNAESPKTFLESYVSFARKLKCPEYVISNTLNSPDLSSDEKISHLKTLMGTKIELYTSWLLVVDNVRSISNIYAHLPESGDEQWARGQLLITTQDIASVPSTSCFIYHVSVSKGMELQDARSLLEKLSGISDCETDKVALVLDYQPLALAIAATYVREAQQNNANFGWKNYLQRLDKGQGVATARIFVETNPTYPKSMNEVSEIAVEEAMKSSNAVLKHTLTLLSFCAAQPLSLEIVVNYIRNVEIDMQDEDDIRMKIRRCPLFLFDENESREYIRVHQVTHDAISNVLGGHTQGREIIVLKAIVKSLFQFVKEYKLNDPDDLNSVVKGTRIVPHLQMLVRTIRQKYSKKNASEVAENDSVHTSTMLHFNTLAITCVRYCAHVEAKEYYQLLGSIMVNNLGPEHVDVARMDNNLGIVHLDLDELDQAKVFYDRAVPALLEELGPENVDVASTYQNLGNVHLKLGELSQAKECYDRTLAIRLKKLGPEHVDVAKAYQSLGNLYLHLGELSLTKQFYDRALAILLKRLGPEHVDITSTYQNLGIVHRNLGELSQAKEFYDRALAIRLKKLGPDHVDVAKTCCHLGKMHFDLGELSRAKEFYDRALAILLKKLGPEHVDVAIIYENLGNIQLNLGELSHAKEFYDRALALRLKKLGPEHVDVAKTYINLGNMHLDLGELNQAKEFYDRALAILLKKLGPDHVDVANTYSNLGNFHLDLGELSKAREFYDRALAILLKKLGPDHVDVAKTYSNLGNFHLDLGELSKAREFYDRALAILLKKLGPGHVDVASTYENLGNVHLKLGELVQAKEFHDRALAIRLKKLGPEHVDIARMYNHLGNVHLNLGELSQAKDFNDRALAFRLKKLGPEHVDVASTYQNLGNVHLKLGELSQAKEFYGRALAILLKKLGPDHVDVAKTYKNMGNVHLCLGELSNAKEFYDRAVAILLKKLGPDNVDVANAYEYLGNMHCTHGELSQAKEFCDRAMAILLKKL